MVLYWITLIPLAEEIRAEDPGLLTPFYADNAAFDRSEWRSSHILKLLLERGPDWGYLNKPERSLFISNSLDQEEAANQEFKEEGLQLNFVVGS